MTGDSESHRVLVWGAGAIGAAVAVTLRRKGVDVSVVDRNQSHVDAINARGLELRGTMPATAMIPAFAPGEVRGTFDIIFLSVKAQATADAAAQLTPHLTPTGVVVSLQNGLNENAIAASVGADRVIATLINQFYADYLEPGIISYQGHGIIVAGEMAGGTSARVESIVAMLDGFRASASENVWSYKWAKLVWGALLVATAIENIPMADALADESLLPIHVELMQEVTAVATSQHVTLASFPGFDGAAAAQARTADDCAAILRESANDLRNTNKQFSGIWRDLAVHHRKTEVEAQYAPVLGAARDAGIAIPTLTRLVHTVARVEAGELELGQDAIDFWLPPHKTGEDDSHQATAWQTRRDA